MPVKIVVIGAGSIGSTRRILKDVLSVPELAEAHFAFHDISRRNLDMITRLAQRDIDAADVPAALSSTADRRRAPVQRGTDAGGCRSPLHPRWRRCAPSAGDVSGLSDRLLRLAEGGAADL